MKKTINFTAIAITLAIAMMLAATSIIVVSATQTWGTQTEVERAAARMETYTPEYASVIEQIAQERGVEPWKVKIYDECQYSVKVEETDGDYVGAGSKNVEVWYLSVDGSVEPIYAEERYLTCSSLFDLTPEDILPAINETVGGHKADEVVKMHNEWIDEVAQSDNFDILFD